MPDRLQQAITVLQSRFGSAAPRPADQACPARPSGISELAPTSDLKRFLVLEERSTKEGASTL